MSELGKIDRPSVTFSYEPWGREVTVRALGARQLLEWQAELSKAQEGSQADQAAAFARYLSLAVIDPAGTAEEWQEEATLNTLIKLAGEAMQHTGLDVEQKKTD
jgi:hypothetical protein